MNSIHDLKNVKSFCSVARAHSPGACGAGTGGITGRSGAVTAGRERAHLQAGWRSSASGAAGVFLLTFLSCEKYQFTLKIRVPNF